MFVVYESIDEVLVTTTKKEKAFLKRFFAKGYNRMTEEEWEDYLTDDERHYVETHYPHIRYYSRTEVDEEGISIQARSGLTVNEN